MFLNMWWVRISLSLFIQEDVLIPWISHQLILSETSVTVVILLTVHIEKYGLLRLDTYVVNVIWCHIVDLIIVIYDICILQDNCFVILWYKIPCVFSIIMSVLRICQYCAFNELLSDMRVLGDWQESVQRRICNCGLVPLIVKRYIKYRDILDIQILNCQIWCRKYINLFNDLVKQLYIVAGIPVIPTSQL